jgi:Holliday junction resolvase RusA-like endonuclease
MREDNPNTKPWRAAVASEAIDAMQGRPLLAGPLALEAVFYFPRPKSHYRSGAHAGELKPNAPTHHTSKPDADKLLRAVGDAITGIVCRDDSLLARVTSEKRYGTPRAEITVQAIL